MAIYITITDTDKQGWISVKTNALYPDKSSIKEAYMPKDNIRRVEIVRVQDIECVGVNMGDSNAYFFTNDLSNTIFLPIESVNGASLSSLEDLKNKILAIL